ncbi:MAG: hypothetical protein A2W31_13365 [Planctomycetes bacterium RBG_16_64_10]|nr:MAG: hypothetical protein A2W31_13365 [Planctomycetes bacterium RBG_16_64_10]
MLFAHAVLGCCSHHIHSCGESHGSIALGAGKSHCSDVCGDHSAGNFGPTGHEQQGRDDCQGSRCDFGRPANEREAKAGHVLCQSMAVLLSDPMPALVGGQPEHERRRTGVLPPVRLHLVHQVLLI